MSDDEKKEAVNKFIIKIERAYGREMKPEDRAFFVGYLLAMLDIYGGAL